MSGIWHPERSSNRSIRHDTRAINYYAEGGEQRVIEAQRIGAQQSVPVDFRGDAGLVNGRAVDQAIDRVVRDVTTFLGREGFVADADGLDVEVVVRVSGRAWPAVPGVTTPDRSILPLPQPKCRQGGQRVNGERRDRHLAAVGADTPRVAQSGDRVVVTDGPHVGRVGLVVAIHLSPDGGLREAAVLLDTAGGGGGRLHRLADGLLRVLDHPTTEETR